MTTHSSTLAWRILWTEEPASPSPWGHRAGNDRATNTLLLYPVNSSQLVGSLVDILVNLGMRGGNLSFPPHSTVNQNQVLLVDRVQRRKRQRRNEHSMCISQSLSP